MPDHPVVHIEIPAANPASDSQFYADVFGWTLRHEPSMDYHMFEAKGGPGGGFVKTGTENGMNTQPGQVLVYIDSDDIDATLADIEAHGGKTVSPKMEIPGTGWFAIFTDPTGNRMALYTAMNPSG
jgi:predicted enzyme related to lactoylglutathione lyase